ncbi:MAG TPA: hypothetical protein PK747_08440 [Acidobacteriota bacterium]|nr:hypothetical protein [Acidobacteriota bacterium]HQQ47421.1 hypothetical protein [Acidobacteriota bacterium]
MREPKIDPKRTAGAVALILTGVAALVMKSRYHGPAEEFVHSYGGNFCASFAVYFLATITSSTYGLGRIAPAVAALLVTELFELTDGFGFMSNTYDPYDLLANPAGILAALAVSYLVWPEKKK